MGGPAPQSRLLRPRVQISSLCLLARCICSDLGNFALEPNCHGWLTVVLVDIRDSTLAYILYAILIGPVPFCGSRTPHGYETGYDTDMTRI